MDGAEKNTKKEAAAKAEAATKVGKASKKAKSTKEIKPVKETKPQREKVENPVVFAFRLSEADRERIHDAAGSARASRFVLAAALAAANGDTKAFEAVVASRATSK